MPQSNSLAFYDEIRSNFLYGQAGRPANLIDEALIRPDGVRTSVSVSKSDYMEGPGRFALPSLFKIVQAFFDANDAELGGGGERTPTIPGNWAIRPRLRSKSRSISSPGALAARSAAVASRRRPRAGRETWSSPTIRPRSSARCRARSNRSIEAAVSILPCKGRWQPLGLTEG